MAGIKGIPPQFINEFIAKQTLFVKVRIQLFTVLVVGIYFMAAVMTLLFFDPAEFKFEEVYVWIFLLAGAALLLYLNKKAKTLAAAKLNAYLFTVFLLAVLTKLCMIYVDYAAFTSSLYVFMLFLVTIVIPLSSLDTAFVAVLHLLAYFLYFLYVRTFHPTDIPIPFSINELGDGVILLTMAFLLAVVIRHKEMARDIENFVLLKEVETKNSQMEEELELARRIHQTLIPKSISTDLADIAVLCLPMRYIGGDYTRFHFVKDDKLVFVISDITGHGVSAALLVNRLHTEFERLARDGKYPGALLKELDIFIKQDFEDTHMYLSAFCGLLDFRQAKFFYSNYGHPSQYIYRVTESHVLALGSQTSLLGLPLREEAVYEHNIAFNKGDMILLFTDGVIETRNAEGEEYGEERLERFIAKNHALSVNDFNQHLMDELNAYKYRDFKDDISVLSMRIKR